MSSGRRERSVERSVADIDVEGELDGPAKSAEQP
jgi:hypothetical protein